MGKSSQGSTTASLLDAAAVSSRGVADTAALFAAASATLSAAAGVLLKSASEASGQYCSGRLRALPSRDRYLSERKRSKFFSFSIILPGSTSYIGHSMAKDFRVRFG